MKIVRSQVKNYLDFILALVYNILLGEMFVYDRAYVLALENIIMDDLLPMYIIGCRSVGIDPKSNLVLKKLMDAKMEQREIPWILKNGG